MTVKLAVWAMIISSALALVAGLIFLFANLEFVAQWFHPSNETVKGMQKWTRELVDKFFPAGEFDKWLGSINMAFQGLNAVVTFVCSKFVSKSLPAVAEANWDWHWVSVVRALDNKKRILRVKRGQMTVRNVHREKERDDEPNKVITGFDVEIDGQPLTPPSNFYATDIIVGTLGTERIIFNYQYVDGSAENGISNLSLVRGAGRKSWYAFFLKKSGSELIQLYDRFLVDGLVGKGEAYYFKTAKEAQAFYNELLLERTASAAQG